MKRPFSKVIVSIAAGGVLLLYLSSQAISFKAGNNGEKVVWSVEAKSIDWKPAALSLVCLAALYTGRIDWVIDAAEDAVKRFGSKD
jgi:hypothetical protein